MEIREIINILRKEKIHRLRELNHRVNHISDIYLLAKHDLKVIKNLQDVVETLDDITNDLEKLQQRIIDRNKKSLL